jgi:hypothetical protein
MSKCFYQCCGSATGTGTIRNFWPDPDAIRNRNKRNVSDLDFTLFLPLKCHEVSIPVLGGVQPESFQHRVAHVRGPVKIVVFRYIKIIHMASIYLQRSEFDSSIVVHKKGINPKNHPLKVLVYLIFYPKSNFRSIWKTYTYQVSTVVLWKRHHSAGDRKQVSKTKYCHASMRLCS